MQKSGDLGHPKQKKKQLMMVRESSRGVFWREEEEGEDTDSKQARGVGK